jgi:gas vesicle protein
LATFSLDNCKSNSSLLNSLTMSAGKIISGVLIGAAAGAVLGILFAPDSGIETRKRISERSNDLADNLKNKFNDFVDAVSNKFQSAKEEAKNATNKGKEKFEEWKGNAQSAVS